MPWRATTSAPALGKGDLMQPAQAAAGDRCLQFGVSARSSVTAQATLTHRSDDPGNEGAGDILLPGPCSYPQRRWVLDSSGHVGLRSHTVMPRDAPELQGTKLSPG